MIITADGFSRRGKIVSLKDEVDKACEHCPTVEKLLSFVMQEMILHHITMTFREYARKRKPFIHAEEMQSDASIDAHLYIRNDW